MIAQVLARQLSRVDIGAKAAQVAAVTADVFANKVTSLLRRLRTASAGDSLARLDRRLRHALRADRCRGLVDQLGQH